jgi:hypothetical protein
MFEAIGGALLVLLLAIVLYYYSTVLMNALWNSKGARKARKEAVEAFIETKKFIERYKEYCDE